LLISYSDGYVVSANVKDQECKHANGIVNYLIENAVNYVISNMAEEIKENIKDYLYQTKNVSVAALLMGTFSKVPERCFFSADELYMLLVTLSPDEKTPEYEVLLDGYENWLKRNQDAESKSIKNIEAFLAEEKNRINSQTQKY